MSLQEETDILKAIPFFADLDTAKLKLIALSCDLINYGDGDILFYEGDAGDCAYILLEGEAHVVVSRDDVQGEHVIATLTQNALVGEIALLCDIPRTATVRANGDLQVLRLDKENFLELLHEFSSIAIGIAKVLAGRLEQTDKRLKELLMQKQS